MLLTHTKQYGPKDGVCAHRFGELTLQLKVTA